MAVSNDSIFRVIMKNFLPSAVLILFSSVFLMAQQRPLITEDVDITPRWFDRDRGRV